MTQMAATPAQATTTPQEVVRFTYRPVPRRPGELFFQGRSITLGGLAGEHIIRRVGKRLEFYELALLETMAAHAPRPIDVAVDVGANIGNHSVFFGAMLGARLVCIEPSAQEVGLLRWNLAQNGLDERAHVFRCAAGCRRGTVKIKSVQFAGHQALSHQIAAEGEDGEEVELRTVDDLVAQAFPSRKVSILKIDVDGYERPVLEGAAGVIERDRPLISVEFLDDEIESWVRGLLEPMGYRSIGPFAGTPTYIFSTHLSHVRSIRARRRIWKGLTRGKHLRAIARAFGQGRQDPCKPGG